MTVSGTVHYYHKGTPSLYKMIIIIYYYSPLFTPSLYMLLSTSKTNTALTLKIYCLEARLGNTNAQDGLENQSLELNETNVPLLSPDNTDMIRICHTEYDMKCSLFICQSLFLLNSLNCY